MDEQIDKALPEKESGYTPRPKSQVWLARLVLIGFILLLVFYYAGIFGGGV